MFIQILSFLIIFALFFFGIDFYVKLKKEKKSKFKNNLIYALVCSVLTVGVLALMVYLF